MAARSSVCASRWQGMLAGALALAGAAWHPPAQSAPPGNTDLPTFTLTLKQGRITPASLEVPAGQRIKLVLRNEGPGPSEFENLDMHVEKILAPGAQSFVVLPSLRGGRYRFVDEFHPEAAGLTLIAR
ncbi:MAG: cupredoxin domain-containing protein [Acidobacteriota bacterium]